MNGRQDSISGNRIGWINGLKGLACICVFVHHFTLIYFPAAYNGPRDVTHFWNVDTFLSDCPFNFVLNGNFWVFVFILISGYVIFRKVRYINEGELGIFIIQRYLKLFVPVFFIETIIFILCKLRCYPYLQDIIGTYSILDLLFSAWYKVPILSDNVFVGAFGMLKYIFLGTFIAMTLAMIESELKSPSLFCVIVSVIFLFLFVAQQWFYCAIVLGSFVCFMNENKLLIRNKIVNILLFILGLLGGGIQQVLLNRMVFM